MLCDQLKLIRKANKITQQQLSDALGIERSTYASYETGRNKPDVVLLKRIASVFGVNVDYILEIDATNPLSLNDIKVKYEGAEGNLLSTLSSEEKSIIAKYRLMSEKEKKELSKALNLEKE